MPHGDKHFEAKQPGSNERKVAGTPITKSSDSALKQRQEQIDAVKSYRLTYGDNPFTIDLEDGQKVQDKRPPIGSEQVAARSNLQSPIPGERQMHPGRAKEENRQNRHHVPYESGASALLILYLGHSI